MRRVWALFRGLRGVDRRFYLGALSFPTLSTHSQAWCNVTGEGVLMWVAVATSILRTMFLPLYLPNVLPNLSSDPFPHTSIITPDADENERSSESVFARRGRETAVFDRFIAMRVGEDLRRTESELTEEGEGEGDIFTRLQVSPAHTPARIS